MFFDRYEKLCRDLKKTPTGVAVELGIGRGTVSYWKNGNTPKQDILTKIASYFNVSTDYLLGNTDVKRQLINDDAELNEYLDELRSRSEMRMLFSVSKGCTKDEVMRTVKIIEALRKKDDE